MIITPKQLRDKGWSIYAAAKELNKSVQHVHQVLLGVRPSKRLMDQLYNLPARPLRKYREPVEPTKKNKDIPAIKKMREKGWSITSASRELGVTYQHLSAVLKGQRTSHVLMARVEALPAVTPHKSALTQIRKLAAQGR